MTEISRVLVIGYGVMGRGIAKSFADAGFTSQVLSRRGRGARRRAALRAAIRRHGQNIDLAEPDTLRPGAGEVHPGMPQLGGQAGVMALHATHRTMRRIVRLDHVGLHLMAACATLTVF